MFRGSNADDIFKYDQLHLSVCMLKVLYYVLSVHIFFLHRT